MMSEEKGQESPGSPESIDQDKPDSDDDALPLASLQKLAESSRAKRRRSDGDEDELEGDPDEGSNSPSAQKKLRLAQSKALEDEVDQRSDEDKESLESDELISDPVSPAEDKMDSDEPGKTDAVSSKNSDKKTAEDKMKVEKTEQSEEKAEDVDQESEGAKDDSTKAEKTLKADRNGAKSAREDCEEDADQEDVVGPEAVPDPVSNGKDRSDSKSSSEKLRGDNKENFDVLNENGPIDLSTPTKKSHTTPDVIMLSDEEEEAKMNGHMDMFLNGEIEELSPEKLKERRKMIRRLQEDLRNEEAKLVLLKKIRQSQTVSHAQDSSPAPTPGKIASSRPPSSVPPPLVRGGQSSHKSTGSSNTPPQLQRGGPQHHQQMRHQGQGPPPLVMAPRNHAFLQQAMRGMIPVTTPPNLIPGYRPVQPQPPQQPEQTPAQRQAAAKLALRKQLEKTLLQIPPPKPPPPEMNFIPSLASNEFIMLVGLEKVVDNLMELDAEAKGIKQSDVKYVFNPFVCVQCGTDFTPVWKRDKPGSKNVICESCVTNNQKKALKQEHTNRLKSAFVKALQQEQEIEQRMQSQTSSQTQATTTVSNSTPATVSQAVSSPMNLSTAFKPSTEQMRQHQNLIQAHQAQLRNTPIGMHAFNPRLAFPYQAAKAVDLQRQYLLDMIPPRSMPQGTVMWKS